MDDVRSEGNMSELKFKAAKRRRTVRRRSNSSEHLPEPSGTTTKHSQRRKHGLSYAASQPASSTAQDRPTTAPIARDSAIESAQADRFVQSGQTVVLEDKHMLAFIDAKIAEMRSSTAYHDDKAVKQEPGDTTEATAQDIHVGGSQPSQTKSTIQKRKDMGKTRKDNRFRVSKRLQAKPTEADIARDQLVDQILKEGATNMYERPRVMSSSSGNGNVDNDVATAARFKAEFLSELEDKNFRKPLTQTSTPQTGPRLGGSRMVRERMKHAEEHAKSSAQQPR